MSHQSPSIYIHTRHKSSQKRISNDTKDISRCPRMGQLETRNATDQWQRDPENSLPNDSIVSNFTNQ